MISATRQQRRALREENARWPTHLVPVDRAEWPRSVLLLSWPPVAVWRSRNFLAQLYATQHGAERLSICRTVLSGNRWEEGISWDDLQRLKREAGFADFTAVEIFPPDADVVNVANMRHLWLIEQPLPFQWAAGACVAARGTP